MMDFVPWAKTPRLFRGMVVSEKIDGTNAAIAIEEWPIPVLSMDEFHRFIDPGTEDRTSMSTLDGRYTAKVVWLDGKVYLVGAQSRKRMITPEEDNFGFARWVFDNAEELVQILGVGRHYGEWWGSGIQRGYGLTKGEKRFSLFNVKRYEPLLSSAAMFPGSNLVTEGILSQVPVLYEGPFDLDVIQDQMQTLRTFGSKAAYGFMNPEGVVVFHEAAGQVFKSTLVNDEAPKGQVEAA